MGYSQAQLEYMLGKEKARKFFSSTEKPSKYRNEKVGGVDSKKEYRRLQELLLLEKTGKIRYLKIQVPFLLQESFERNGKKEREIKYIADFVYLKDGDNQLTVEDSKGMRTDVYNIKRKMFLKRYGENHYFIES